MDNRQLKGNPDNDRINLNEDYEVRYWTDKWGITKAQLEEGVKKAGSSAVAKIHDALRDLGYM